MKRIAILGSTGSIGRSALAVVDAHPTRLQVAALAAGDNASLLAEQIETYRPRVAAIATAGEHGIVHASRCRLEDSRIDTHCGKRARGMPAIPGHARKEMQS